MLGGDRAAVDELVDAERREPRAEPLHQRTERGAPRLQLDHVRGRGVVARVGGDERVEVRADDPHLRLQVVHLGENGLERGDVGVGHGTRFDLADVVFVEQRDEPVDRRVDAFDVLPRSAVVESRRRCGVRSQRGAVSVVAIPGS